MAQKRRMLSLLCAIVVMALVFSMLFVLSSCKDKKKPVAQTTLGGTTTNTPGSSGPAVTTNEVVVPGRDEGEKVEGTLLVSGTNSADTYYSLNGIVVLDDGSVILSDETKMAVYVLKADGTVSASYSSTRAVNGVCVDGDYVYSFEGGLDGTLVKLDKSLKVVASVEVGHTPEDMVVYNGKGYVANRFSNTVSVINLADMSVAKVLDVDAREPNCLAVAGSKLYVGSHLNNNTSKDDVQTVNIQVYDLTNDTLIKSIPLVNGTSAVKDICVSPDGARVYVSHVIGRYTYPTTQLDRGWVNTNGFSIIKTSDDTLLCTPLIDEVDEGAANPWGITVSADGKYLCVAVSGTNEVILVNIAEMDKRISRIGKSAGLVDTLEDVVDYIPFLADAIKRVKVGVGVREIYEKGGKLYCALYFDGTVEVINLADASVTKLADFNQPEADTVRRGLILWSDANNCYQKWQSCNSCHPDGVVDGFNWDNLNDGLGNAKSAKSMLYAHRTPPVMVTGIRKNAEIAVAAGMKFIQFNVLSDEDLACIDEYLKSMLPIESPYLEKDGTLTETAEAGKAIFAANCASCHPAPLYTDMNTYDVGTGTPNDSGKYDTPTLVEIWRTGPYMHNGSVLTIEEVVKIFAPKLSDDEVKKVSEYVLSICAADETYGVERVYMKQNGEESYNKYVAGASLTSFTVRKQAKNAEAAAASLTVYSNDGKILYYCDVSISGIAYNTLGTITLAKEIVLPEGGSVVVNFVNESGEKLASSFTLK